MNCVRCQAEYTRMAGVQRFRCDYGYCSLQCLELSKPPCPTCGAPVTYREGERTSEFARRRFCTQRCAALAVGAAAVADGRMGTIHVLSDRQAPARRKKLRDSWERRRQDGTADEIHRRRAEGLKRWRAENPEAVAAALVAQNETKRARGRLQEASERMKAFFRTPEGEAEKERQRSLRVGKPRPPLVTQKMKDSLRRFWDSPEGVAMREHLSFVHTDGEPDTPYGPGWLRQAARIRRRDGCCVLCRITRAESRRVLDVHHIKPKRAFGYVPGQNTNYRWANHAANLVTLCQPCHRRVELKVLTLPPEYTERSEALWVAFTQAIRH